MFMIKGNGQYGAWWWLAK